MRGQSDCGRLVGVPAPQLSVELLATWDRPKSWGGTHAGAVTARGRDSHRAVHSGVGRLVGLFGTGWVVADG